MKCPSSKASAARNSARMSSSLIIRLAPLGPASAPFNTWRKRRLRLRKAALIEQPNSCGAVPRRKGSNDRNRGDDETDWMGDCLGRCRAYTCSRADACERAQPDEFPGKCAVGERDSSGGHSPEPGPA